MNFFDNKLVGGRYRDLERCFGRSKHIQKLLVLGGFGPEQISYSGCAKKKRICLTQQGFFSVRNSGISTLLFLHKLDRYGVSSYIPMVLNG